MSIEKTTAGTPMKAQIVQRLRDLAATATTAAERLGPDVERAAVIMREVLRHGGTLFFCGNGGSAADAQHLATEYVVRYMRNRRALPAIALTTDTSLLTATGNDLGFDEIFARQVEALVTARDVLVIHSTSGNSPNVIKAAEAARQKGAQVIALSSRDGGQLRSVADHSIIVPTDRTDRAQEIHLCIEHAICEIIEAELTP
ncbi:MAG TPA: SIS domain-containing protein [Gemmatimonadaceae bacterium]|nr:SIS domain-containing protein [Gemmatimonadaceae bacterium]